MRRVSKSLFLFSGIRANCYEVFFFSFNASYGSFASIDGGSSAFNRLAIIMMGGLIWLISWKIQRAWIMTAVRDQKK